MKVLFALLGVLLLTTPLSANTKQIVLDSFQDIQSANTALEKLQNDEIYEKLYTVAKENHFNIHLLPLKEKTILVLEPIEDEQVLEQTLKLVIRKYQELQIIEFENPVMNKELVELVKPKIKENTKSEANTTLNKEPENKTQLFELKEVLSEVVPLNIQQVNQPVIASQVAEIEQTLSIPDEAEERKSFPPPTPQELAGTIFVEQPTRDWIAQLKYDESQTSDTDTPAIFAESIAKEQTSVKKYQLSEEELRRREQLRAAKKYSQGSDENNSTTKEEMNFKIVNKFFSAVSIVGYYWLLILALIIGMVFYYFAEFKLLFNEK